MENSLDNSKSTSLTDNSRIKDEGIMSLYLQSLKASIENDLLSHFKDNENYSFSFKELKLSNAFLIKIKLKKLTELNPFATDAYFYIQINEKFPESVPYVTCNSNFCFPSLFDNRNLISSIITFKWQSNSKLTYLIESIPRFLKKYASDIRNKILTYYGEYKLNEMYDINDFFLNPNNHLFKVEVEMNTSVSSKKELNLKRESKYIIITDIYILIFMPLQTKSGDKTKARLSFMGELKEIVNYKYAKIFSDDKKETNQNLKKLGIILQWNKSTSFIPYEGVIVMDGYQNRIFEELIEERSRLLLENFSFFHEDFERINSSDYLKHFNQENILKLERLIDYKESLLEGNIGKLTDEEVKDLMMLYQKIIEIYSAVNNKNYLAYMKKLQSLLESNEQNNEENQKKDSTNSFSLFT